MFTGRYRNVVCGHIDVHVAFVCCLNSLDNNNFHGPKSADALRQCLAEAPTLHQLRYVVYSEITMSLGFWI